MIGLLKFFLVFLRGCRAATQSGGTLASGARGKTRTLGDQLNSGWSGILGAVLYIQVACSIFHGLLTVARGHADCVSTHPFTLTFARRRSACWDKPKSCETGFQAWLPQCEVCCGRIFIGIFHPRRARLPSPTRRQWTQKRSIPRSTSKCVFELVPGTRLGSTPRAPGRPLPLSTECR